MQTNVVPAGGLDNSLTIDTALDIYINPSLAVAMSSPFSTNLAAPATVVDLAGGGGSRIRRYELKRIFTKIRSVADDG